MSEQSQKTTGIRDARTLGIPKMLLLGIQHINGLCAGGHDEHETR